MAYETGFFTGSNDLLAKIKTFLESDGWTTNLYASDGAGYRLHVEKAGVCANLRSTNNERWHYANDKWTGIAMNLSTGFDAGAGWYSQPGAPPGDADGRPFVKLRDITSTQGTYWCFSNGTQVAIVAAISSSLYGDLHWGELTKCGSYSGGMYFSGNGSVWDRRCLSFHVYTSYALAEGVWYGKYRAVDELYAAFDVYVPGESSFLCPLLQFAPCVAGVVPLLPIHIAVNGSGYWPLGWVPNTRVVRRDNLSVAEEITLGEDTWVVLPLLGANWDNFRFSEPIGLAIKKTT